MLHYSAAFGDADLLKDILKKKPELVNAINKYGMTALHAACFHGHLECVQILLEAGADANIPSASANFTFPLHLAVTRLQKEIVELLILNGRADPRLKDYRGQTPLDIARELSLEGDSMLDDEDEKAALITCIQECSLKINHGSLKPFAFVSSRPSKAPKAVFAEAEFLTPNELHLNDFFKSDTAITKY